MALNFPAAPSEGDEYEAELVLWKFLDGGQWPSHIHHKLRQKDFNRWWFVKRCTGFSWSLVIADNATIYRSR